MNYFSIFFLMSILTYALLHQSRPIDTYIVSSVISQTQDPDLRASINRGSELYEDLCMTCHLPSGKGVEGIYPPLAASDFLAKQPLKSIKAVKYGMKGEITVNGHKYNNVMANPGLSNKEVADVMNFINHSWENNIDSLITEEEVSKIEP